MASLNRRTGQVGQNTRDVAAQLGGLEAISKRKLGRQNDYADQDLYNIKEHFRCMNKGFAQLRQGRTH